MPEEIPMSKIFVAAFLFLFAYLFSGAALAVPVLNFDGDESVMVLKTLGDEIPTAFLAGVKKLDVNGGYPKKVALFFPGYLSRDSKYVMDLILPGWKAWEAVHPHSTLIVCSRIPTWCRIIPPAEVKDLAANYQDMLEMELQRDFFGAISKTLVLVEADIASRDASLQEKLRRQKEDLAAAAAFQEAEALAEKVAAQKASEQLRAAQGYLQEQKTLLQFLLAEGGGCCWHEISQSKRLLQEPVPTGTLEIYEQASRVSTLAQQIQFKVKTLAKSREESLVLVVGIVSGLLGIFIFWAGFSRFLRQKLKDWLEQLEHELVEQASYFKQFQGKTALAVAPLLSQLGELYQHLNGAKSSFILFGLRERGFVFPIYLWIIRRQVRLIRGSFAPLLELCRVKQARIMETQKLPANLPVNFNALLELSSEAVYRGIIDKYSNLFGESLMQHLSQLRSLDPDSLQEELAWAQNRQLVIASQMQELAEMLYKVLQPSETRSLLIRQIYQLRGEHAEDPADAVLTMLRGVVTRRG